MALKPFTWYKRSVEPLNDSTVGILNRGEIDSSRICWEKRDRRWILVDFLKVIGKVIQNRASNTPCRLIMALKPFKWSKRPVEPSNNFTVGILNWRDIGSSKIYWEKEDRRLKSLPLFELLIWIFINFFSRSWIFCLRSSFTFNFLLEADDFAPKDWSIRSKTWLWGGSWGTCC